MPCTRPHAAKAALVSSTPSCHPKNIQKAIHAQAFLLISIGAAAAARAVHTYRSSLWTQGAVAVSLGIAQASLAFRATAMGLPVRANCGAVNRVQHRWCPARLLAGGGASCTVLPANRT